MGRILGRELSVIGLSVAFVCLIGLADFASCENRYYKVFYMKDYCLNSDDPRIPFWKLAYRSTIPVSLISGSNSSGILKMTTPGSVYSANLNCSVFIRAPPQHQIVVTVLWKDICIWNSGVCKDSLKIYNDPLKDRNVVVRLCGLKYYHGQWLTYSIQSSLVMFEFNSFHRSQEEPGCQGFELTFTALRQASEVNGCGIDYSCNKQYCTWIGHVCDGRNNCGDNEDESRCYFVEWIVVFATLGAFLLMVAICSHCVRTTSSLIRKCRKPQFRTLF